jgi:hypothetical protein
MMMDGRLMLPSDGDVEFGTIYDSSVPEHRRRRMSKQTGTNRVLVIRAEADDGAPQDPLTELEDAIFGRYGNTVNLMTIYRDCSYGQMTVEPFQGVTSTGVNVEYGVTELKVQANLANLDRFDAESFVEEEALNTLGDLRSQFDHVMICLPPGTTRNGSTSWLAYAYVNSWLSVYNDKWCSRVSTNVHGKLKNVSAEMMEKTKPTVSSHAEATGLTNTNKTNSTSSPSRFTF